MDQDIDTKVDSLSSIKLMDNYNFLIPVGDLKNKINHYFILINCVNIIKCLWGKITISNIIYHKLPHNKTNEQLKLPNT